MTHDSGTAHLPFAKPVLDGNDAAGGSGHHPIGSGTTDSQHINPPGRTMRSEVPEHFYGRPVGKWKAIDAVTLRARTHFVGMRRPREHETQCHHDTAENDLV
jgi:hypothetical protein